MWDKDRAYRFIFLMGFVSLLSDFTYEGAKGIIGPYLAYLGASALAVGLISGLAELAGYWIRLLSGILSDKFKSYWLFTLWGYALNLFSVPLLAFVKSWPMAGLLVFLERFGKGLRTPSRDALLSRATSRVGHGKGFGLHEFLDQVGAVLGPLVVGLLLFLGLGYRGSFLFLFIPAFLALSLLFLAKKVYKDSVEDESFQHGSFPLPREFYVYILSACLVALAFLPFPLMGFHLTKEGFEGWKVSVLFALAMSLDAIFALLFGLLFDKIGFSALALGLSFGIFTAPLLFVAKKPLLALVLWGASLGVQESIMRSAVAKLSPEKGRAKAYGLFHFFFGLFAFFGASLMGYLYETSLTALVFYSVILQLIAVAILLRLKL
ncbi:MAG: MFS transporter [Aquificaceae bacterium]